METSSMEDPKALAKRIRDRKHWMILWFILIAMVPTSVVAALGVFPSVEPKYLLFGGLLLAVGAAQVVHNWLARDRHPRCRKCGGELEIMESGPSDNHRHFEEGGTCPHCGTPL